MKHKSQTQQSLSELESANNQSTILVRIWFICSWRTMLLLRKPTNSSVVGQFIIIVTNRSLTSAITHYSAKNS